MIAFHRIPPRCQRLAMAAAWLAAGLCAFGCVGGSGSSGFDIAESFVIQRVGQDQECEEFDGLIICPADASSGAAPTPTPPESVPPTAPTVETPAATETATPLSSPTPVVTETMPLPQSTTTPIFTPIGSHIPDITPSPIPVSPTVTAVTPTRTALPATSTPSVPPSATPSVPPSATPSVPPTATPSPTALPSTDVFTNAPGLDGPLRCARTSTPATCVIGFRFRATGLPETAAFRVAARPVGAQSPWSILVPIRSEVLGGEFEYSIDVSIDLSTGQDDASAVQLIVLAFDSDPGPVPDRVTRLADTGADRAFVVAAVPIEAP